MIRHESDDLGYLSITAEIEEGNTGVTVRYADEDDEKIQTFVYSSQGAIDECEDTIRDEVALSLGVHPKDKRKITVLWL